MAMTQPPPADPLRHDFHPAVSAWFNATFPAPTEAQRAAWPLIQGGRPTLIAAPTGSGKTLTAFLAAIDELVRDSDGQPLPDATRVLYISPLKALSNDIRLNLQAPLEGIGRELAMRGLPHHARIAVRAARLRQRPRHAVDRAHRDRRRNPRRRRHQAWQPPGPEPGTPGRAVRSAAGAHRPVRHPETLVGGGALSGRPRRRR